MPTSKIPAMNSQSSNTQRESRLSSVGGAPSDTIPVQFRRSTRVRTPTRFFVQENAPTKGGEKGDDYKEELKMAAVFARAARRQACSTPYWKKTETYFAPITPEDLLLLKQSHPAEVLSGIQCQVSSAECDAPNVIAEDEASREQASLERGLVPSLFQRTVAALIQEDEIEEWEGIHSDDISEVNLHSHDNNTMDGISENEYQMLSLDDRLLLEYRSIGLDLHTPPPSEEKKGHIQHEIEELQEKLHEKRSIKKQKFKKIEKATEQEPELEKRTSEEAPFEKLIEIAKTKLPGWKKDRDSATLCTEKNIAFIERTLNQCKDFEKTGRSCFSELHPQGRMLCAPPRMTDKENMQINCIIIGSSSSSDVEKKGKAKASAPPATSASGTKRKRSLDKPPIPRATKKSEKVNVSGAVIINEGGEKGGKQKRISMSRENPEQRISSSSAGDDEIKVKEEEDVTAENSGGLSMVKDMNQLTLPRPGEFDDLGSFIDLINNDADKSMELDGGCLDVPLDWIG